MIKSANIKEKKVSKKMFNNEDDKKQKISEDEYFLPNKNDSSFYDCRIKSGDNGSDINFVNNSTSSVLLRSKSNSISKYFSTLFYTLQLIILSFIHGLAFVIYKTFRCQRCRLCEDEKDDVVESEYKKENN